MVIGRRLKILFIHYDLPAQFKFLIEALAKHHDLYGICQTSSDWVSDRCQPITLYTYSANGNSSPVHPHLYDIDRAVRNAQCVAQILEQCKKRQIVFDIALAHTGWGEALYFKDIFPETPLIGYVEFFFRAQGADAGFDPEDNISLDESMRIRALNAQLLLGMSSCDALVTPTYWQKSLFPKLFHPAIEVIHEGVDIEYVKPNSAIEFSLPNGLTLTREDEVVTYTARNLEPYRGFPTFLKAAEEICRRRPNCHMIVTGGDEVSYSKRLPGGESYRHKLLPTVQLPHDRVHFLGYLPYQTHLQLLQLSSAHVYLTYPFVLSWSFIEAMASACVMIASDTQPVLEVLKPGKNGLTVNFYDYIGIADRVDEIFNDVNRLRHLGDAARQTIVDHFQHKHGLNRYWRLFRTLL